MTKTQNENLTLFGSFNINNYTELDKLVSSIEKEQAIFFLIEAAKYANNSGVFSMNETEIISKSIRKLFEKPNNIENDIK